MSPLRTRRERLAADSLVVIRGGTLDKSSLRADAERTFRRFGERGVSVLAAPTDDDLDLLARTVLRRYETLTVTSAGAIRRAGLELRPTFRRPHYTVMFSDLDTDVERLTSCENEQRLNRHFRREEAE